MIIQIKTWLQHTHTQLRIKKGMKSLNAATSSFSILSLVSACKIFAIFFILADKIGL